MKAMGVQPGDRLRLEEDADGFVLRSQRIDCARLAPLRDMLQRGHGDFDPETFREHPNEPALRDCYIGSGMTTHWDPNPEFSHCVHMSSASITAVRGSAAAPHSRATDLPIGTTMPGRAAAAILLLELSGVFKGLEM